MSEVPLYWARGRTPALEASQHSFPELVSTLWLFPPCRIRSDVQGYLKMQGLLEIKDTHRRRVLQ